MKVLSNWSALLAAVSVIAASYIMFRLFGFEITKGTANVLVLGEAVTISITWFWAALRAFRRGGSDDISKIILSVWLAWTALIIQRVYVIVAQAYDRADWLVDGYMSIFVTVLILISGGYAVMAPSAGENVPRRERIWTILGATIGGAVIGAAGTLAYARYIISA